MRRLIIIFLLFIYHHSFSREPDTTGLQKVVKELNKALLEKDSIRLGALLHGKVQYGHSNGWIETKDSVIGDLFSGKLVYYKIEQTETTFTEEKSTACVRSVNAIDVALSGERIQMKLHVLQVWIKEDNDWVLLSRQSTRIN